MSVSQDLKKLSNSIEGSAGKGAITVLNHLAVAILTETGVGGGILLLPEFGDNKRGSSSVGTFTLNAIGFEGEEIISYFLCIKQKQAFYFSPQFCSYSCPKN
jgi:hypothetical protein